MKRILFLLTFGLTVLAQANPARCISLRTAKDVYQSKINDIYIELDRRFDFDSNFSGYGLQRPSLSVVVHAGQNLKWNSKAQVYQGTQILEYACAAGADCWIYPVIQCDGTLDLYLDGED